MNPSIHFPCPECSETIAVPYVLLGVPRSCSFCGQTVVPKVPVGAAYPTTRFELTFLDFEQLIRANDRKHEIGRLLARWFDYEILGVGDASKVRSREGEEVDIVELHQIIQKDPEKQRQVYGVAMDLWR